MFLKLSEDGKEVIFVDEIYTTFPFIKPLLALQYNKGRIGDMEGRLRTRANKELLFLYVAYVNNGSSIYEFWSQEARIEEGKKLAGLPDDFVPSKELQVAIDYFIEIRNKDTVEVGYRTLKQLADDTLAEIQSGTLKLNEKLELLLKAEALMKTLQSLESMKNTLQQTRKARGNNLIGNREEPIK